MSRTAEHGAATSGTTGSTAGPGPARRLRDRWDALVVAVLTVLTGVHAALVWPTYGVGSFDDDGHYLLLARNLVSGVGFVDTSRVGDPVDPLVPPGYPALIAPLVALPGDDLVAARLLSLVCAVALVPLTDVWLRRERVGPAVRVVVALLLAGNVVLATYASMVMAETPFLLLLVATFLLLRRVEARGTVASGVLAGVALAGLLLLKTAAVGLVAGALLFLLLRRRVRAAIVAGLVVAFPQVPLAVVRLLEETPAVGDRYAQEISTFSGPLQLVSALSRYAEYAIADTLVPLGPWFLLDPRLDVALTLLRVLVAWLVVVGAVVWWRRTRDATVPMVAVYFVEVLFFPFVNERRVVLVLPLAVLWLVLGGDAVVRRVPRPGRRVAAVLATAAVVLPLALQPQQNYRFPPGEVSSRPAESEYLAMLAELRALDEAAGRDLVVQTSYRWTVSAFTGAHTSRTMFDAHCAWPLGGYRATRAAEETDAGYVVVAAFHEPLHVDDPCLLVRLGNGEVGAVRLMRRPRDLATVFQLVGPGTPWPDDVDHLADAVVPPGVARLERPGFLLRRDDPPPALQVTPEDGTATLTLELPPTEDPAVQRLVRQVSVGAVHGEGLDGVELQLRRPDGTWETVDARPGDPPYLLARLDEPRPATAVRVVARSDGPVTVEDVTALGPTAPPRAAS